jgi:hypothetical protein
MKTFESHFNLLKNKIENNENFAFLRFSDGELFVLQNKRLELNENHYVIGNYLGVGNYNKEEQKKFAAAVFDVCEKKHKLCYKKMEASAIHYSQSSKKTYIMNDIFF